MDVLNDAPWLRPEFGGASPGGLPARPAFPFHDGRLTGLCGARMRPHPRQPLFHCEDLDNVLRRKPTSPREPMQIGSRDRQSSDSRSRALFLSSLAALIFASAIAGAMLRPLIDR